MLMVVVVVLASWHMDSLLLAQADCGVAIVKRSPVAFGWWYLVEMELESEFVGWPKIVRIVVAAVVAAVV
jgi:hypothetical protein